MKYLALLCVVAVLLSACFTGCGSAKPSKIGVSLGPGSAARWAKEKVYMETRAKELDAEIDVRLGADPEGKSQMQVCLDLIDSGVDVLIFRPKDTQGIEDVIASAKENNVKLISYAGLVDQQPVDLFVGYDCEQIGQTLGKYLSEMVIGGDYILLSGAPDDKYVSSFLYSGAMKYIDPIRDEINVILDASVPNWSADEAKTMVRDAIVKNGNKVDAILAPNDAIAGACVQVIDELDITNPVVITGMDAQLDAAKRIVAGTQSCTVYMDLETLANTAVEEADKMVKGKKVTTNAEMDNGNTMVPANLINKGPHIPANLISGQLVIKGNLDRILIDTGYFSRDEIYGADAA